MDKIRNIYKGRSASGNPPNRFEKTHLENLEIPDEEQSIANQYFVDHSKTILAKNNSYDIPFNYSLNPYRGCEHGCIYCYARQTHEYLGFSSGLDFETKIMVKTAAPELLEATFRNKWKPELIVMSGDTDCYQPIERKLKITRRCLEVFLKYRNPVALITKSAMIERDIDILTELASLNLVNVTISITTLDAELSRKMEPRAATPVLRLDTISALAEKNIPVGVNIAPLIPGLNDREIPLILKKSAENGASFAHYIPLRLPYSVKDLFVDWLNREYPERASRIINRIKDMRGGKLNESAFEERFIGKGENSGMIENLFRINCNKYKLNDRHFKLRTDLFKIPSDQQLNIFES